MTDEERLDRLTAWQSTMTAMEDPQTALMAMTAGVDGPLFQAIGQLMDDYTAAIAEIVGDEFDWLDWWQQECDYGKRPKEASASADDPLHLITTIEDLARLIA